MPYTFEGGQQDTGVPDPDNLQERIETLKAEIDELSEKQRTNYSAQDRILLAQKRKSLELLIESIPSDGTQRTIGQKTERDSSGPHKDTTYDIWGRPKR